MTDRQPRRKIKRDEANMRIRQRAEDGLQSDFVFIKLIFYLARSIHVRSKMIQYLQRHPQRGGRRRGRMWAGGPPRCRADLLPFTRRGRTICSSGSTWQPLVSGSCESLRWLSFELSGGGGLVGLPSSSPITQPPLIPPARKSYFLL